MEFEVSPPSWARWPEREDLSTEFTRLIGAAQEGGSAVAECLVTASRIDFSDDDSWYREWKKLADANRKRGNAALHNGNILTARSNWLRAVNYYQAAAFPFRERPAFSCAARSAVQSNSRGRDRKAMSIGGKAVSVPWSSPAFADLP